MRNTVLMSIKPKYVSKIFEGTKRFEFRKHRFVGVVEKVIIYASSPIRKVVGEFMVDEVLVDLPERIWHKCKDYAGIEEEAFFEYFRNFNVAVAIGIKSVVPYAKAQSVSLFAKRPPQSFLYVK